MTGPADRWRAKVEHCEAKRYERKLGFNLPPDQQFDRLYDPTGPRGIRKRPPPPDPDGTESDGTVDLPPEDSPEAEEGAMFEEDQMLRQMGWD